jgi:Fe-S-cluster containining protein
MSYGKPADVDGECNAHLYIADDYGDNSATMRCQRPVGHEGPHKEIYGAGDQKVEVTWSTDERVVTEEEVCFGLSVSWVKELWDEGVQKGNLIDVFKDNGLSFADSIEILKYASEHSWGDEIIKKGQRQLMKKLEVGVTLAKTGRKQVCAIYNDRPEVCRTYPHSWNTNRPNTCGFYFDDSGVRKGCCDPMCEGACCSVPRTAGEPLGAHISEKEGGLPCKYLVNTDDHYLDFIGGAINLQSRQVWVMWLVDNNPISGRLIDIDDTIEAIEATRNSVKCSFSNVYTVQDKKGVKHILNEGADQCWLIPCPKEL